MWQPSCTFTGISQQPYWLIFGGSAAVPARAIPVFRSGCETINTIYQEFAMDIRASYARGKSAKYLFGLVFLTLSGGSTAIAHTLGPALRL